MFLDYSVTLSPPITFPQPETSPKTPQLVDIWSKEELNRKILTLMVPEEVMMKLWLEVPSLTLELLTNSWTEKLVHKLFITQLVKLEIFSMLLLCTRKMDTRALLLEEKNTVLDLVEIGLLKDHFCRVLRLLLPRVMKESIDPTWLVWVFYHWNSRLVRDLRLIIWMERNSIALIWRVVIWKLDRMLKLLLNAERNLWLNADWIPMLRLTISNTEVFYFMFWENWARTEDRKSVV